MLMSIANHLCMTNRASKLLIDCDYSVQEERSEMSAEVKLEDLRTRVRDVCARVSNAAALCSESGALEAALEHVKTAEAAITALQTTSRSSSSIVSRRQPSTRNIDKQLRFTSTKTKGKSLSQKPRSQEVSVARNQLKVDQIKDYITAINVPLQSNVCVPKPAYVTCEVDHDYCRDEQQTAASTVPLQAVPDRRKL